MSIKEDKGCFPSFDLLPLILQPFKTYMVETAGRIWAFFMREKDMKKYNQVSGKYCVSEFFVVTLTSLPHDNTM